MTRTTKINRAMSLRAQGWTYQRIADEFAVSYTVVYRWLNPNYDAKVKGAGEKHREANLERIRARQREQQRQVRGTPEGKAKRRALRQTTQYRTRNAQNQRRRRARKRGNGCAPYSFEEVLLRDAGRCGICGQPVLSDLHIDHIVPIAKGGADSIGNVQLAHPACNLSKGDTCQ